MFFFEQKIKGVFLIKPNSFRDKRGVFRRHFCKNSFLNKKIYSNIRQANISENKYRGTLRGFHYQKKPYSEDKTLSCIKGEIYDIVCDLRPKSKTYKKWMGFFINEKNRHSIHIPKGCANAFLTLSNDTVVHYYCSQRYHPKYELGLRYNDPLFNFVWPILPRIISKKDKSHKNFIQKKNESIK